MDQSIVAPNPIPHVVRHTLAEAVFTYEYLSTQELEEIQQEIEEEQLGLGKPSFVMSELTNFTVSLFKQRGGDPNLRVYKVFLTSGAPDEPKEVEAFLVEHSTHDGMLMCTRLEGDNITEAQLDISVTAPAKPVNDTDWQISYNAIHEYERKILHNDLDLLPPKDPNYLITHQDTGLTILVTDITSEDDIQNFMRHYSVKLNPWRETSPGMVKGELRFLRSWTTHGWTVEVMD